MTMKKHKKLFAMILSLVFAAAMLFMPFTDSVWAEDGNDNSAPDKAKYALQALSSEGDEEQDEETRGVHKKRETFEKNYCLSLDQKEYAITGMADVVEQTIAPGMSDLEKYYRLAIVANQLVEYDWEFWGGGYDFDYYSHQWDSYGAMNPDEKSVCVGIAIFYSHLCHAAGLPCKFVRLDPDWLDHTISYVPDINGNAYYVDVTENVFLMSEQSINSYEPNVDKNCEFATIPQRCTDASFDFYDEDEDEKLTSGVIKEFYDVDYADWYQEYALHDPAVTDKKFGADYVEKGSGTDPAEYHASYNEYPSNFVDQPDVWFLDDFYKNPAEIKEKILTKQFDKELLNVSNVKKNYDCDSQAELESMIAEDISVRYFPSRNNGEVVAEADALVNGTDYEITCTSFDLSAKTAEFEIEGKGGYTGTYEFSVKLNSSAVASAPVSKKGLVYNGKEQALIEPGVAESGEMQYAVGDNNTEPPETFTADIPTRKNAGKYYVWYKAVGDADHGSSEPECLERAVKIAPIRVEVLVDDDYAIEIGESTTISPKLNVKVPVKYKFESGDEEIATVDSSGVVTGLKRGIANIYIEATLTQPSDNYVIDDDVSVTVAVGPQGDIDIEDTRVVLSQTAFTYNGKVQRPTIKKIKRLSLEEGTDYEAAWSNESSTDAGTYTVTIKGMGEYFGTTDATYTINKAPNPMTLKGKTVKVKRKSLKKKAKSIESSKAFKVSGEQGALSYKLASAKKGKKSYKKKFKINQKTGKVTLKKGLKKGTYKVKVKVKAKGSANYKASAWKAVTFKVRVK